MCWRYCLLLSLLVIAAPAQAVDPFDGSPPGSQWAGHEINGKVELLGFDAPS